MSSLTSLTKVALAVSLMAGSAGLGVAVAAETPTQQSNAAAKDYGRLSIDGAHAFEEIGLARLAIYDGKPAIATRLVADARTSLMHARTDDSVFTKAETDLQPPKNASATVPAATDSTPKTWLPVDGVFTVDETLQPTSDKAKAVQSANLHMRNGEPDKAKDTLKVADIDADYTLAVAPLKQSMADINRATQLLAAKDYYNASQALRQAQDGVRYDTVSYNDVPGARKKTTDSSAAAPSSTPSASTPSPTPAATNGAH